MSGMFDVQEKVVPGKVVIKTRPSPLVAGSKILRVLRNTADDAAITTAMTEHTDIVKFADMAVVMSAFVASVKELVANGNAVRVSGLGTFYITAKEGKEGEREFDVGFTPDKTLVEAAKSAEAKAVMASDSSPVIETVQDMDKMSAVEENGEVSGGKLCALNGRQMRVAGDEAETGIFMVPCDDDGNYKKDMSDWVRADSKSIWRNNMKEVIFKVPKVAGKHRICIATKAPLNGNKREEMLLKHARVGVSMIVTVV